MALLASRMAPVRICEECNNMLTFIWSWVKNKDAVLYAHNVFVCDSCGAILQERVGKAKGATWLDREGRPNYPPEVE